MCLVLVGCGGGEERGEGVWGFLAPSQAERWHYRDLLHPQGSLCPPAPELLGRAAPKPPAPTGDVLGKT